MNEFIVWDEEAEIFIDEAKCILANGTLFRNEKDFANEISDDLSMFFSIGLKDINNQKIYADSSIIEFDYMNDLYKGYFYFDKKELMYFIKILESSFVHFNKDSGSCFAYTNLKICDFKIIDTMQENKLGLIKDKEQ